MDFGYYESKLPAMNELKEKIIVRQAAWFRQLALIASAVLGINVSIGSQDIAPNQLQWLGNLTLILCILSSLIASYFEVSVIKKSVSLHLEELQIALSENRKISPTFVRKPIVVYIAEFVAVLAFVSSLLLLLLANKAF